MKNKLLLFCMILLQAGCATQTMNTQNSENTNSHHHVSELFEFPEAIGDFKRIKVTEFDSAGTDIGVLYRLESVSSLTVTIYAYPTPKLASGVVIDLIQHYSIEEDAIIERSLGTKKITWPTGLPMWSDEGVPCVLSAYKLGGSGMVVSLLQLCDYSEWRLKFRSSYTIEQAKEAEENLIELHKLFKWPSR